MKAITAGELSIGDSFAFRDEQIFFVKHSTDTYCNLSPLYYWSCDLYDEQTKFYYLDPNKTVFVEDEDEMATSRVKNIKCEIDPSDGLEIRPEQGWLVLTFTSGWDNIGSISISQVQIDELIDYLQNIQGEVAE